MRWVQCLAIELFARFFTGECRILLFRKNIYYWKVFLPMVSVLGYSAGVCVNVFFYYFYFINEATDGVWIYYLLAITLLLITFFPGAHLIPRAHFFSPVGRSFAGVVWVCVGEILIRKMNRMGKKKQNNTESAWTVDALIYIFSHYFAFLWKVQ